MNERFDVVTSKSLLEKLRVLEDRRAWSQFVGHYLPMMQTWGRRFGLLPADVDELTSRLLVKLVETLPRFEYDPEKGSFRGWLKTVTQRELANFARERQNRPADAGTGHSAVYDLLLERAADVDDLVASVEEQSEGMLHSIREAMREVEESCGDDEQASWQVFRRIFIAGEPIETVAREVGVSYHAAAMRVQRIKKKVRTRALQLATGRGLT